MPWCPKCRTEYHEGCKKCSDCDAELVKRLPPEHKAEPKFDTEAFLVTVDDEAQASVVESLLHSFGIPTARNYKEAGSYVKVFTGTSAFGIDIYVPSHNLDQARDIMKRSLVDQPAEIVHSAR